MLAGNTETGQLITAVVAVSGIAILSLFNNNKKEQDTSLEIINHKIIKKQHYPHHQPSFLRLNHGSFGSPPACVITAKRQAEDQWNSQPDGFFYSQLNHGELVLESLKALSPVINCPTDNMCLLDNATTGAVIVAQYLQREFIEGKCAKGDVILLHSYLYGAVNKVFKHYVESVGAELVYVPTPFPVNDKEQIVAAFESTLKEFSGRRIRLALLDHITSIPCVIFPLDVLSKLLRSYNVEEIFIDGAHAVGSVPLDLGEIDCDYYTSNCHKWLFCPASVAFFYYKDAEKANKLLHHPITSHPYTQGVFAESNWIGTRDYSAFASIPAALNFVEKELGGIEKVMKRNTELAWEVGTEMAKAWGTRVGTPKDLAASMVNVKLPAELSKYFANNQEEVLRDELRSKYGIECFPYNYKGEFWIRLSVQVYNGKEDYVVLRQAIDDLLLKKAQKE